jgi:hypothetical protein
LQATPHRSRMGSADRCAKEGLTLPTVPPVPKWDVSEGVAPAVIGISHL